MNTRRCISPCEIPVTMVRTHFGDSQMFNARPYKHMCVYHCLPCFVCHYAAFSCIMTWGQPGVDPRSEVSGVRLQQTLSKSVFG